MYEDLKFTTRSKAYKDLGIAYLGGTAISSKLDHSKRVNVATYGLYFLQSNLSGYSMCKNDKWCKEHCLGNSGHNMVEILSGKDNIKQSRLKKTRLFHENHQVFMQLLVAEIAAEKLKWEKKGYFFAVRLNCSSDIDINRFQLGGINICDIFKSTNFYEYTKVFSYLDNMKKYSNLDYTMSYNGYNQITCKKALERGVRIAIVFEGRLPNYFNGVPVIDGDAMGDYRPSNPKYCVVGLKLKKTSNMISNHKFVMPSSKFIVPLSDKRCS